MAYRIETGRLDKAERTPQGGLRIPAAIGRSGPLRYRNADGSERVEYRPPEETFRPESLATLRGAPVTDLHPAAKVTPETFRTVARGHVADDARADSDGKHIAATLYVQDSDLVRAIEAGERRDVSAGYEVQIEETPGVLPDGTRYDAIQRGISYNHVAIGPKGWGRAGSTVALRLDDAGNALNIWDEAEEMTVKKQNIDGIEYEIGSDTWTQAMDRHAATELAARTDLEEKIATATKERDEQKGRADQLAEQLRAATDTAAIQARVASRVALERKAVAICPGLRCDGLSDREVMAKALKMEPQETDSDDYIRGRFDREVETSSRTDAGLALVHQAAAAPAAIENIADAAFSRLIESNRRKASGNNGR